MKKNSTTVKETHHDVFDFVPLYMNDIENCLSQKRGIRVSNLQPDKGVAEINEPQIFLFVCVLCDVTEFCIPTSESFHFHTPLI